MTRIDDFITESIEKCDKCKGVGYNFGYDRINLYDSKCTTTKCDACNGLGKYKVKQLHLKIIEKLSE